MKRYDAALSKMIKERQSKRANIKAAAVAAEHFRYRALDLIEIALAQAGPSPQLYTLAMPLLRCQKICISRMVRVRLSLPMYACTVVFLKPMQHSLWGIWICSQCSGNGLHGCDMVLVFKITSKSFVCHAVH